MKQTTKSLWTTLAVAGAAAAIGAAALWVSKDTEKKAAEKEKAAKLFEGLDKQKARSVRLVKEGKPLAVLTRADANSAWKLAEPLEADADGPTVDAIVSGLAELRQKKELDADADAKQYGLDPARITVSVKTEDGKEWALEVGESNPFDSSFYFRREGDKTVRIADGYLKAPFEKELFDLRDKRVLHLDDAAEVRKIEVSGVQTPYALEKDGANWKLLPPIAGAADAGTADRVASALKGLRATAIASEIADAAALKRFGLSPPKITAQLSVAAAGGKDTFRRALVLGQPPAEKGATAKTYAKRDDAPTVFEVDGQIVKDLGKDLFELQDKSLVHADREAVRKMEFAAPGAETITVLRKKDTPPDGGFADETFEVIAPRKGPAKKWKLSSALYSVTGLRAAAFGVAAPKDAKGLAKLGLDKPRTVTLFGEGDKVLARVQIGAETAQGKRRWVLVEGAPRIAEVEKTTLDELPKSADDVIDAPPPPAVSLPDGGAAPAQAQTTR